MNSSAAERMLREAASRVGPIDRGWEAKVQRLSQLCEDGTSKTHITFLGTSMLAKALDARADLRAIKPKLAPGNDNAYSARSLCHGVLVPVAAELGFSLGVSGREPLNNQPYFRMTRLGDATPVHTGGRAAFDFMLALVDELQGLGPDAAREALRAYIAVRRRYQRIYAPSAGAGAVTPGALIVALHHLVSADSEGGRRAQAAVAGLLDVFAGTGRVQTGRINDPPRHYPGDVAVLAAETAEDGAEVYEKAFEVRDKPVRFSDVALFGRTCVERGVREAAMVLVSEAQPVIDHPAVRAWSEGLGVSMTIFVGWEVFTEACLFWASPPQSEAAILAVETIRNRLMEVEASPVALATWERLTRQ